MTLLENILNYKTFLILVIIYIITIIVVFVYFDPLNQGKGVDLSGNEIKDHDASYFGIGIIIGIIIGGILLIFGLISLVPDLVPIGFWTTLFKLILLLLTLGGLVTLTLYLFFYTPWPLTLVIELLNIAIIVITLALIFKSLVSLFPTFDINQPSRLRLIKTVIFYIPCLFIDLINYLKEQYQLTTPTTWILLLIEVLTIGLRLLLPIIYKQYNKLISPSGDLVKKGPISLHHSTNLGIFQNHILALDNNNLSKKATFNYNYAISCWIWINPQPPSTSKAYNKVTSILNYGDVLKINYNKYNIEILAATTERNKIMEQIIEIYSFKDVPYQRWNNFILNYNGGTLDIFINNKLVSSTQNISPIMYYNKVTAGDDNGIYGGIKDIIYYDHILSSKQINAIYNQ